MKLEKETALYNRNAIANEISNFTNEIVEINGGLQQLEQQIDGQVVTWFYNYTPTFKNRVVPIIARKIETATSFEKSTRFNHTTTPV